MPRQWAPLSLICLTPDHSGGSRAEGPQASAVGWMGFVAQAESLAQKSTLPPRGAAFLPATEHRHHLPLLTFARFILIFS